MGRVEEVEVVEEGGGVIIISFLCVGGGEGSVVTSERSLEDLRRARVSLRIFFSNVHMKMAFLVCRENAGSLVLSSYSIY